ncbi:MAG: YceI family protein [Candidatus Marinimicrobia bacterium]|nr:YceI family protein [Candidatus Neomarinimicrobiota bacterium]
MKNIIWLSCILCMGCGKQESQEVQLQKASLEVTNTTMQNAADTLWIDKLSSDVQWIGRKVTGEHSGRIQVAGGFIVKNNGVFDRGEILMNMQSITVDDIEDPKWNQKLVDHLKNDDFFNAEKYPTAKFVFDKFKGKGADTHVSGNLTIRDKTVPTNLIVNVVMDSDSSYSTGSVNVDRSLFDVKYGSGSFFEGLGDKMIMDDFTLNFKLIAR